jgi:hypothetical protein
MALENNKYCFPFEGKLWVSELPREETLRQITTQRAWDAANARYERWGIAIAIGATAGVIITFAISVWAGMPPALNLFLLPIGFAVGAVLGARVNKVVRAQALQNSPLPDRPTIARMIRVPRSVAAKTPEDATAREIIELIEPQRR